MDAMLESTRPSFTINVKLSIPVVPAIGVTINLSGKGDDDLTAGQIAGAASGTLPDVFMNSTGSGAILTSAGALKNLKENWEAMPAHFREQFNPELIKMCMPSPDKMYCIPYTGFGSFMYRNLDVLEADRKSVV